MKNLRLIISGSNLRSVSSSRTLLALLLWLGATASVFAQGQIASGTVSGSGSGPNYNYNLTFSDDATATSPIGSVWYGWTPDGFYLPGTPSLPSAPTGWNASVLANSIEFTATAAMYDIGIGQTLSGFGYTATFDPSQLAGENAGLSVAYVGGIESGPGNQFSVALAAPEPSTLSLLIFGGLGLRMALRRRT